MARPLKQSTSADVPIGPFLDATDGITAETGLTITQPDVRLKKNNGNWAQKAAAQTLTHEENGFYEVTLDATDTDTLGLLRLAVFESGACPVWEDFIVVPANVYDSMFSTDKLEVDVVQFGGTNLTASGGRPEVNLSHIAGSAVSTSTAQLGVNAVQAGGTAWGSGAITAASIANGAIDAATFAADVDAEILSYIVDDATRIDASDLNSKIDSLTFTQAGHVDANVQRINDVAVTGDGSGTPFGV